MGPLIDYHTTGFGVLQQLTRAVQGTGKQAVDMFLVEFGDGNAGNQNGPQGPDLLRVRRPPKGGHQFEGCGGLVEGRRQDFRAALGGVAAGGRAGKVCAEGIQSVDQFTGKNRMGSLRLPVEADFDDENGQTRQGRRDLVSEVQIVRRAYTLRFRNRMSIDTLSKVSHLRRRQLQSQAAEKILLEAAGIGQFLLDCASLRAQDLQFGFDRLQPLAIPLDIVQQAQVHVGHAAHVQRRQEFHNGVAEGDQQRQYAEPHGQGPCRPGSAAAAWRASGGA